MLVAATSLFVAACGSGDAGSDESSTEVSDSVVNQPTSSSDPAVESTTTAPSTIAPRTWSTGPIAPGEPADDPRYTHHTLIGDIGGAAGAVAADLNGDGILEVVVNTFGMIDMKNVNVGTSSLIALYQDGGPTSTEAHTIVDEDEGYYFLNQPWIGDIDDDGDPDIIAGIGFFVCASISGVGPCGALVLWENTGVEGGIATWSKTEIIPDGQELFYHRPAVADIDGDGLLDIIAIGETSRTAETFWFRGSADGIDDTPLPVGTGGGSLPVASDVDGDGDLDIVSGQYFQTPESVIWFEHGDDDAEGNPIWTRHTINSDIGKVIQVSLVPDLDGPGRPGWVASNHTNTTRPDQVESGVYRLTPGDDPRQPWSSTILSTGIVSRPTVGTAFQAAPGVFSWGDVDGDGDIDLTVSGDGDDRLFLLEQDAVGVFTTHVLQTSYAQAGSMEVVDLNGDGSLEILASSFEAKAVRLYVRGG